MTFEVLNAKYPRGELWDMGWENVTSDSCVIRSCQDLPAPAHFSFVSWRAFATPQSLVEFLLHIELPDIVWLAFQEDYEESRLDLDMSLMWAKGKLPEQDWELFDAAGRSLKAMLKQENRIDVKDLDIKLRKLFNSVGRVNMHDVEVRAFPNIRTALDLYFELREQGGDRFNQLRQLRSIAERALHQIEIGIPSGMYLHDLLNEDTI